MAVNTHRTRITRPWRKPRLGVFNQRHETAQKESSVTKEQSVGTKPTTQKMSNKLLLSFEKREMKLSFF